MLTYAGRDYWRLRDENRWRDRSILDAVPQQSGARPGDASDDDQQVTKSPNTESAIQSYAMALDPDEMSHWLNKIVEHWRADNAAAGLSVLDHKPLPKVGLGAVAKTLSNAPERDHHIVLSSLLAKADPGVKLHVAQQLSEHLARSTLVKESGAESLPRELVLRQDSLSHPTDLRSGLVTLSHGLSNPANGSNSGGFSKQMRTYAASGSPQFAPPSGASGTLDEDVGEAYDQDGLLPDSASDRFGPPWYDPGAWRREHDPRSGGNTRLIGAESLTDDQRRNLAERNWIFPTDGEPEYGPVGPDYPYFGARRNDGGRSTFHAGYDARLKKPPAGSGQKADRSVVVPTRAKFIGFSRYASDGKTVINAVKFDLGNGLVLEMLHVEPTAQILALDRQVRLVEARAGGAHTTQSGEWQAVPGVSYPELDAGLPLGEVDPLGSPRQHDHTHMQLIAYPNSQRSSVDITPYMERRARRYWRQPTNDWLERRYDDMFGADLPRSILPAR